jgi:hypothetical protein
MFTEASLRQYPELVKAMTGIDSEAFWEMMTRIEAQTASYELHRHERLDRKRGIGAGRRYAQPLVIRVTAVLTYLRLHVPQSVVAWLYDCNQADICRDLRRLVPLIGQVLPRPAVWDIQPEEADTKPDGIALEALAEGRALIDATEQQVSRPQATSRQEELYSGKKKLHTLKTQMVADSQHYIHAISQAISGSLHDKKLADALQTIERLPDGCEADADKGYQGLAQQVTLVTVRDVQTGLEHVIPRLTVKTPFKKPKGQELSAVQERFNQALGAIRVRIEHCFGWAKNWAVLATRFRCHHAIYTPIFQLICGLVNAQTLAWQKRKAPNCE